MKKPVVLALTLLSSLALLLTGCDISMNLKIVNENTASLQIEVGVDKTFLSLLGQSNKITCQELVDQLKNTGQVSIAQDTITVEDISSGSQLRCRIDTGDQPLNGISGGKTVKKEGDKLRIEWKNFSKDVGGSIQNNNFMDLDLKMSIEMPGEITEAQVGEGKVSGNKVTWDSADAIINSKGDIIIVSQLSGGAGAMSSTNLALILGIGGALVCCVIILIIVLAISRSKAKKNAYNQGYGQPLYQGQPMQAMPQPMQPMPGQAIPNQAMPYQAVPGQQNLGQQTPQTPTQTAPGQSTLGQQGLGQAGHQNQEPQQNLGQTDLGQQNPGQAPQPPIQPPLQPPA